MGIQRARERQRRVGVVGRGIAAAVRAGDVDRSVGEGGVVGLHGTAADDDVLGKDGAGGEACDRDGGGGDGTRQKTAAEVDGAGISGAVDR